MDRRLLRVGYEDWVCGLGWQVRVDLTYDVRQSRSGDISRNLARATSAQWHERLAGRMGYRLLMLAVMERQQKGTWHWHCLLRRAAGELWLPAKVVWDTWAYHRGFTKEGVLNAGVEGRCHVIYLSSWDREPVRYVVKYAVKDCVQDDVVYWAEVGREESFKWGRQLV